MKVWLRIRSHRIDFNDENWYEAFVPGTVLGSLVTGKVVEDPYFGINMQKVDPEQFKQPWWFRTSFNLSGDDIEKKYFTQVQWD